MRQMDTVRALERSPYFKGNPETVLHAISMHVAVRRFGPDERLAARGAIADAMFLVVEGQVAVRRKTPEGEKLVSTLQPGMFIGHVALVEGSPYSASYTAVGSTVTLEFKRGSFQALVQDMGVAGSAFRRALIIAMSNHLGAANRKLSELVLENVDDPDTEDERRMVLTDLSAVLGGQSDDGAF